MHQWRQKFSPSKVAHDFFSIRGQKMDLFAQHVAIKSTLRAGSRKMYLFPPQGGKKFIF